MSLLRISRNTGAKEKKERGLWKPEFDPPRSTSRLVKDGAETALFRKLLITHGREEIVYQWRVATFPFLMISTHVQCVTVSYNTLLLTL